MPGQPTGAPRAESNLGAASLLFIYSVPSKARYGCYSPVDGYDSFAKNHLHLCTAPKHLLPGPRRQTKLFELGPGESKAEVVAILGHEDGLCRFHGHRWISIVLGLFISCVSIRPSFHPPTHANQKQACIAAHVCAHTHVPITYHE